MINHSKGLIDEKVRPDRTEKCGLHELANSIGSGECRNKTGKTGLQSHVMLNELTSGKNCSNVSGHEMRQGVTG